MSKENTEKDIDIKQIVEAAHKMTVHSLLDIKIEELTKEKVVFSMPVTWKVHQPAGILHGGVSCILAEGAASLGAQLNTEPGSSVVGIEINASHLRSISKGTIKATATPIRIGRRVQTWNVDIQDEADKLICKSRVTLIAVKNEG